MCNNLLTLTISESNNLEQQRILNMWEFARKKRHGKENLEKKWQAKKWNVKREAAWDRCSLLINVEISIKKLERWVGYWDASSLFHAPTAKSQAWGELESSGIMSHPWPPGPCMLVLWNIGCDFTPSEVTCENLKTDCTQTGQAHLHLSLCAKYDSTVFRIFMLFKIHLPLVA